MPSSAPPGLGRLSAISIGRIARAAPRAAEPRLLLLPVVIIVVVDYVVSASSSRRRRGSSRPYAPRGPPPRAPAAPCKRDDVLVLVHVGSRAAPWMCARATHTRGGTTGLYVVQERERRQRRFIDQRERARIHTAPPEQRVALSGIGGSHYTPHPLGGASLRECARTPL